MRLSMTVPVPLGRKEAFALGRELRKTASRASLAACPRRERDALEILLDQERDRLPDLVPVRNGRLVQSPFSFLRGTAAVMAGDLAGEPRTGTIVTACGGAHLANFGLFASPERHLLFDINDFDETLDGPWEWDLKRLAASAVVGGQDHGWTRHQCLNAASAAVRGYRSTLCDLMEVSALQRFYVRIDAEEQARLVGPAPTLDRTIERARRRDSDHLLHKVTTTSADGTLRFVDNPPVLQRIDAAAVVDDVVLAYISTVRSDVALLLYQFHLVDTARRVVGVGSVGTRCFLALLQGPSDEPLFIQLKQAVPSVLATYGGLPPTTVGPPLTEGHRVVRGQRILQAASDPFLGWISVDGHDYYGRQFRDMKGSVELGALSPLQFERYSELCGRALARAHAQHPNAAIIAGYIGTSPRLDDAITRWATSYGEQVERDHEAFARAVRKGRVPVEYC